MLEISAPGVTLLTWKLAEDGDGTILRIQESAGKSSDVNIRNEFLAFEQAWLSNALEDNQSQLSIADDTLSVPIKPFQVITIRIRTKPHISGGLAGEDEPRSQQ